MHLHPKPCDASFVFFLCEFMLFCGCFFTSHYSGNSKVSHQSFSKKWCLELICGVHKICQNIWEVHQTLGIRVLRLLKAERNIKKL